MNWSEQAKRTNDVEYFWFWMFIFWDERDEYQLFWTEWSERDEIERTKCSFFEIKCQIFQMKAVKCSKFSQVFEPNVHFFGENVTFFQQICKISRVFSCFTREKLLECFEKQLNGSGATYTCVCVCMFCARSRVFSYWGLGIDRLDESYRR